MSGRPRPTHVSLTGDLVVLLTNAQQSGYDEARRTRSVPPSTSRPPMTRRNALRGHSSRTMSA